MNMDYVKNELELYDNLEKVEEIQKKISKHDKVGNAIRTGKRYQQITDEDKEIILESLDQLYNTYGNISNNALRLQAETVLIKNSFEKSIKECNE